MEQDIRQKISKELRKLGFSNRHIGTIYMRDAIEIIYKSNNPQLIKCVEKSVYNQIANRYSKKASTIKSNIVKATNHIYEQRLLRNQNAPKSIYFFNIYEKLTPKAVINTVLDKIRA